MIVPTPGGETLDDTEMRQRLAAILAADAAGYSRLMALDDRATLAALDAARAVFRSRIESHQGRVIDTAGDSVLALFDVAGGAVSAALEIQQALGAMAQAEPEDRRLRFRIGIHLGDVIEKADGSVYGDGVNIAARLQAEAEPGAVLVSEAVAGAVRGRLAARIEDLGQKRFKNIATPLHVFRVGEGGAATQDQRRHARRVRAATIGALSLLLAALGYWMSEAESVRGARVWLGSALPGRPAQPSERPLIAVLPFVNQSGDAQRDYFCDGVTEDIIAALGRFGGMLVVSQNATRSYKGKTIAPQELRAQLGARYVVQGSIRQSGNRLRAAVELSDAEKGLLLWSERYDGEGAELFEIQDRIVNDIASSLQMRLTRLEQDRGFTRPATSLEAYDMVLRARWLLERLDRKSNREARELLARARSLAPDYMEVLTATGEAEVERALYGWIEDPADGMRAGTELARQVLASPDTRAHSRAYALLAKIHGNQGQHLEAAGYAERAIALNPSDAAAIQQRGSALLYAGRIDESIKVLESLRRFDPIPNAAHSLNLGWAYYVAQKHQEALAIGDGLAARYPRDSAAQALRAATLAQLNRLDDARAASEAVRRLSPGYQVANSGTRFANPELAEKVREGLRKAGL
jgi:adenylate cyclase